MNILRMRLSRMMAFALVIMASVGCVKGETVINAADYGLSQDGDAVTALRSALEACVETGATKLIIPKGTYDCYPEKATEKYLRVSNNDNGMKRILFPLEGMSNFEIDGQGSSFIMNGQMVAIDVDHCADITLKNFSIDWKKPFYFQGEVVAFDEASSSFDLRVHDECDYEIIAHELLFLEKPKKAIRTWQRWSVPVEDDYGWEQNIDWNIWYDSKTKAPAYNHGESILRSFNEEKDVRYHVEELEPGLLRIYNATNVLPKVGWVLVVKGRKDKTRISPAIHLFHDKNVTLENINVHHSGGMGLIGERCENVTLKSFNVVLPPNSNRMVSTSADATHFVNCKGLLSYDNCIFENMLDDAGNFHGVYTKVVDLVDDYTIGVRRMHGQQTGFQFAEAGDSIRLSDSRPMKPYATLKVVKVLDRNEDYMLVTFDQKVNEILHPNSVADNVSWQADVHFRNSIVRQNRARTILVSTQGDVLIENNHFSTCSSASMLFEGDATYWHESGPVSNVIIRNNVFENFGLASRGSQILRFTPRVTYDGAPSHYYHKNVYFEDNVCEVFNRSFVYANSVENLVIKGNTIKESKDFPLSNTKGTVFEFVNSKDVRIEDNDYQWSEKAVIVKDEYTNVIVKGNKGVK